MLLTNRLNFFDKRGNELNMLPDAGVIATVIDPANVGGYGATFNVYTDRDGSISVLEVVTPGQNYSSTGVAYIRFENKFTGYVWDTDPADLSISPTTGALIASTIPLVLSNENKGFPYPAVTWTGEMYFDMVSTGLIENQDIFVLENVQITGASGLQYEHSYPRADEGVTLSIGELSNTKAQASPTNTSTDGVGTIRVYTYTGTANCTTGDDIIYGVGVGALVSAGLAFESISFPEGTTIAEVISVNSIRLSNVATSTLTGFSWTAYQSHGFVAGMIIRVNNPTYADLVGNFVVTQVSNQYIYFTTPSTVPTLATIFVGTFNAVPVWRGRMAGSEDQIFMYTVEFGEDFPTISKVNNLIYDPVNGDTNGDVYYTNTTAFNDAGDYQYRLVSQDLVQKMMNFHLGFSAETEGSYIRLFVLEDITYPYAPALISQISLRGEAEGLDERLGLLLENFGRDVTSEQELIMRDSDVYEDFTDNRLLNRKRKEMLLQGDQIWPYLGSYRGLVNIVNWFGYYDVRIKEYWLNVNAEDPYYGKYRQLQIPFQLEERGTPYSSISMLPNTVYSKTNKFGLFYDITKETGVLDENGVPLTADAFQFSNEEVLIKLFALKQYLLNNFLPLNTQIVDIVGEGVYYERYAANSWNDRVNQTVVDLTRSIDFEADSTYTQIVDARKYNSELKANVPTPGLSSVASYYSTYTIKGVTINSSTNTTSIPQVTLFTAANSGSPSTYWVGEPYVKAAAGVYPVTASGTGYLVGDVITLRGGTFERPIRVRVIAVAAGAVTNIQVLSGTNQGSKYYALGSGFSQLSVVSQDLTNNLYYSGVGTGFQIDYTDIQYVLEGIKTTTFGKGYPINDALQFSAYDINAAAFVTITYDFVTETVAGPNVGNFDAGAQLQPLTNEPNIPVAAPLNLNALGFEVTWSEMVFSWQDLWSASDASLLAYIDALPVGSGGVVAIEILDTGDGYSSVPTIQFNGGEGLGSTAQAKLKDGSLQLFELEATSIVPLTPTTSRVNLVTTFPIPPAAVPYSLGAMVTGIDSAGNSLQKPATIIFLDTVGGAYFDIDVNYTSAAGNMFVKVHEGAVVTASGSGYISTPYVKTVGGHTSSLYTYDEIGRGNFYEMEWKVTSEEGTTNFIYSTGQKSIDELVNHRVELPYIGKYKVELIVYDTDNNWINEIKRNYVEAYLPQALPGMVTRFIGPSYAPGEPFEDGGSGSESNLIQLSQNCVDKWDEAFYHWDEYWGRWVNPMKTWTTWNDCDVEWSTLDITPLSAENNWTYPTAIEYEVTKVSAYDLPIGTISAFIPKTVHCDTVAGSNILTNVSNYNYSPLPFGGFQVGDTITITGVTTTISNINYTNSTITMVANATLTETNIRAFGVAQFTVSLPTTLDPRPDYLQTAMPPNVYLRKDDNIYQLGLVPSSSTISLLLMTLYLDDISILPQNFDYNYSEWDLLLEVGGTIILADDHYTPNKPASLSAGQFVTLKGISDTPLNDSRWNGLQPPSQWGIPIDLKSSSPGYSSPWNQITFNNYLASNNDFDMDPWINGQIYRYRNDKSVNGKLEFVKHANPAKTVYIERLVSPTEENWGNRVMIYINNTTGSAKKTTANPLDEIRPGFTIIDLVIGNALGEELYQQHFRTINMYEDTSTQGYPWSVWSEPTNSKIICIEAVTLDGKKFDEDYVILDQVNTIPAPWKGWIEYKYDVFPTRVQSSGVSLPSNLIVNLDENTRPVSAAFSNSTYFPATPIDGRGWYYDHSISKGDYSFEVTNVGTVLNAPNQTIVTVNDPSSLLFQCDATYKELARDFNEDVSDKHLGVKFEWAEASNLDWDSLCSQTWTTMDWTYNLAANFKFNQTLPNTPVSLQFNKYEPYITNLFALPAQFGYTTPFLVSLLNNNFYDSTGTWSKNDNPGLSKFYYVALSPINQLTGICTWGDPTNTDLTVLTNTSSPLSNNEIVSSVGIQPGWEVTASTPTTITLGPSGAWTIGGGISWIPACTIHGSFRTGSNKVTNIVGYPASLPQGGWLWDPNSGTVVGKFGPGIGSVVIENGFVISVTLDNPSGFTADNFCIEVYPQYSGIVNFWNPSQTAPIISAYAKNPGADSLGFIKTTNTGGIGFIANNDYLNADVTLLWAHTFPLGNYYNWVQDKTIFYGGGLENSLLQFAQPYRNIQTYIQEGGAGRQHNADGGGWYPSIDWGSYQGFVDGAYAFGSNNENLYNPIVKVTMVDISGNAIINDVTPGANDFYLVLNRSFDGEAVIYETLTNQPFDFTNSLVFSANPVDTWPVPITINVGDYEGDGHSLTVNGFVVNPFDGILGKKAVYIQADYDTNPTLFYDYPAYQLTNVVSSPIQTANNAAASVFEGMYMGYLFGTAFGSGTNHNNTRIASVDGTTIALTDKQILGTGTSPLFYAYVPLSLNLKVQPMNSQIWSRTKQSDSMRLLYEQSMSSAFTWEDTTISLKEKKIPAGTSVVFTSDPSDIAGKTSFKWNLYYEGTKVTSLINPNFLWTFMETGLYDIELEITDTNGNKQTKYNPNFVEVYLADH